jgi:hypothetical protein
MLRSWSLCSLADVRGASWDHASRRCRLGHQSDYDFTAAAVAGIAPVRTRMMMPGTSRAPQAQPSRRVL